MEASGIELTRSGHRSARLDRGSAADRVLPGVARDLGFRRRGLQDDPDGPAACDADARIRERKEPGSATGSRASSAYRADRPRRTTRPLKGRDPGKRRSRGPPRSELVCDELAYLGVGPREHVQLGFAVAQVCRDDDGRAARRPGDRDVVDRAALARAGLIGDGPTHR